MIPRLNSALIVKLNNHWRVRMSGAPKGKLLPIIVLVILAAVFYWQGEQADNASISSQVNQSATTDAQTDLSSQPTDITIQDAQRDTDTLLEQAFKRQQSNIQVQGSGKIIKLLKDDNQGSRHQKMLIQLQSGQKILIAHNIDLSPRIHDLQVGQVIDFKGEYEYNDKGGVIHWTHHDPQGQHEGGWLKYNGKTYQ